MLQILNAPNPILSQKSVQVNKIDKNTVNLIEEMKIALDKAHDPIGVGLAAVQVGKNIRIFNAKPTEKSKIYVFINPIIKDKKNLALLGDALRGKSENKQKRIRKLEGCLSLKDIWGEIKRDSVV